MSRAVPQINILIAGLSGKMILGMVALSLSLPTLAVGVNRSLESAQSLLRAWMGL
jgi:flagellar biosynthesis protein FliR